MCLALVIYIYLLKAIQKNNCYFPFSHICFHNRLAHIMYYDLVIKYTYLQHTKTYVNYSVFLLFLITFHTTLKLMILLAFVILYCVYFKKSPITNGVNPFLSMKKAPIRYACVVISRIVPFIQCVQRAGSPPILSSQFSI